MVAVSLKKKPRSRPDQSPSRIGPHVLDICRLADIVFLGLHGQDGEDGRIQATLDLLGVPYTGAGYLGSAIAMDKIAAKEMMDANGIPNPKWQKLTYAEAEIPQLAETLPMPCTRRQRRPFRHRRPKSRVWMNSSPIWKRSTFPWWWLPPAGWRPSCGTSTTGT